MLRPALFATALAIAAMPALAAPPVDAAPGLPTASEYSSVVLQERAGIVSWKTLAGVEMVQKGIRLVPSFAPEVLALDDKDVTVQGFILPIAPGAVHKYFFISGVPPDCPFCLPAGPEALIEVAAKAGIKAGTEPVVLSGRLSVLKDSADGVLYRLSDAVLKGPARTVVTTSHP